MSDLEEKNIFTKREPIMLHEQLKKEIAEHPELNIPTEVLQNLLRIVSKEN